MQIIDPVNRIWDCVRVIKVDNEDSVVIYNPQFSIPTGAATRRSLPVARSTGLSLRNLKNWLLNFTFHFKSDPTCCSQYRGKSNDGSLNGHTHHAIGLTLPKDCLPTHQCYEADLLVTVKESLTTEQLSIINSFGQVCDIEGFPDCNNLTIHRYHRSSVYVTPSTLCYVKLGFRMPLLENTACSDALKQILTAMSSK